jgi:transposase
MAARLRKYPEKYSLRQTLAEHPFGTLKRSMNQDHFLMRGLEKVKTEMSLSVLAYNLKRAFNILGVTKMKAALP